MDIVNHPHQAAEWTASARKQGGRVAFVPTMGALHEGHLELVRTARREYDQVICSIFVNPLQFNNPEDLAKYPLRPHEDKEALEAIGCHALFTPKKEDLFHGFTPRKYDLVGLDDHWEGPSRPGHFQGVVNVVERLFFFVRPNAALFGEKDRQQLAIIAHVAATERWPVKIIGCPTVRSADGLALSSRNLRLNSEERSKSLALHRSLLMAGELAFSSPVKEVEQVVHHQLRNSLGDSIDYFGIANPVTLAPLTDWSGLDEAVALVAAQVGPVRLIDNMTLRRPAASAPQ